MCIGSGPSLTADQIDFCRGQGWSLATCNQGYKLVPDAALFHALDSGWWYDYGDDAVSALSDSCEIYAGCPIYGHGTIVSWGLNPKRPIHLSQGLSGHNLIELVARKSPEKIVLIGYDGHGQHWHDDYHTYGDISEHNHLYDDLGHLPVVNCTPGSKIEAFPMVALTCLT